MKKIQDEFTNLPISRQAKSQKRLRKKLGHQPYITKMPKMRFTWERGLIKE